jgi:predicted nucleic acid-binding protein
MEKRLSREQKKEQAVVDIINQMFVIAGHEVTFDDIKDRKDNWFMEWTMTTAQAEEWKQWGVAYLRKNLRTNKVTAEKNMMWFCMQWGLKYSDYKI